ncbi:threonine ammonia-lyase [Cypionkella sinensis]|uniref:Threonine/serine dehydratase n=1 Tax=Cypionkella sinensis TaxID=1756043 RepID=A0ABV7J5N7_9RHOB
MNIEMIHAAARRLEGHARVTPLLNAPLLDRIAGRRVLVKAECLQWTGSFKYRGAWAAVSALRAAKGVIAYSSGNHAQGVALAARQHGLPAVIVMPKDAPAVKIANTRAYGAEVVLYDRTQQDRDVIGEGLAAARGLVLVRPYDEPEVIAGQGSVGLEILQQFQGDAEVLACCGGGGLSSGIALACEGRMRTRTVEPAGFDDMARSLAAGERLRNAALAGSVCDAILTPCPGEITFPILQRLAGPGLVVSDDQALQAMVLAFQHLRIVLEPGGAVALAAALFDESLGDTVIAVASGGNVDPAVFAGAMARFG